MPGPVGPVAEAENALNPSLKMTPKEQFIEAANIMCGYTREDLAMLTEKQSIDVIDCFLVLAEEPEKRGNPEICRWTKRLRELRVQPMEGNHSNNDCDAAKNSSTPPISSTYRCDEAVGIG